MEKISEFVRRVDRFIAAHRGASQLAPENTIASMRKAIDCNAQMIELDIQITKDNKLVVFHDDELGRTCEGHGKISELNYSDLKDLDCGSWFATEFSSERIPLLSEAIEEIKGKCYLSVEIKSCSDDKCENSRTELIVSEILKHNYQSYTVLASFDHQLLKDIKQYVPQFHTAAIKIPYIDTLPSELNKNYGIEAFICSIEELNPKLLDDIEHSGIVLGAYSVDDNIAFEQALKNNVKAIGTDNPCLILKLMQEFGVYQI